MRNKMLWLVLGVGIVIGLLLVTAGMALAGSLNPSVGPGGAASQMYTLEQIYTRLASGGNATKAASFTEPVVGPGTATMHTLDDIYNLAWPARVAKTGQTTSYATDDDGALQKGVAWPNPRFTSNTDINGDGDCADAGLGETCNGTVTDNLTGLIWLRNANCPNATRSWATALSDITSLNNAGTMNSKACGDTSNAGSHQTDWRMPNAHELPSLMDYGSYDPALPSGHPFTNVQSFYYWTSSTLDTLMASAWTLFLRDGRLTPNTKTNLFFVWPVRGGQ